MSYGNLNVDTVTTSTSGGVLGAGNASLMKNRIINGSFVIDQRNAGASVTPTSPTYITDRWQAYNNSGSGRYTIAQSSTAATGFNNSLLVTSTGAYSIGVGDILVIRQAIEGYNMADLNWGSANAKTVTLSFWVRSSLTGTFGGSFSNNGGDRNYAYTYTINSANTWEQKTVTITGCTDGTWLTTSGTGVNVWFQLGVGSTYTTSTTGSWISTSNVYGVSGATSVVGTNGATFYITGVQLEVGSSATGFEYRQYGQELALCQRYYWQTPTSDLYHARSASGIAYNTTGIEGVNFSMPVTMRTTPSFSLANAGFYSPYVGRVPNPGTVGVYQGSTDSLYLNNANNGSGFGANYSYFISSTSTTSAKFNAEL